MGNLPRFESHIAPLQNAGGIFLKEQEQTRFIKLNRIGTELPELLKNVQCVFIAAPAYRHELFVRSIAPFLGTNQYLIFISYFAALRFYHWKQKYGIQTDVIPVELQSLPYTARMTAPGTVQIIDRKRRVWAAALPSSKGYEFLEIIKVIFPEITVVENVLFTSLNNFNAVLNPPLMLGNSAKIEAKDNQNWNLYANGINESIARTILAFDRERIQLSAQLGVKAISIGTALANLPPGQQCSAKQLCQTIKQHPKLTNNRIPTPHSLNHRYLTENVPFALIPFLTLAADLKIPTPHIRSVIDRASQKLQRDFYAIGAGKKELGMESVHLDEWLSKIE